MELKKFKLIPAVLALSMMMVPMAYAGADKAVGDTEGDGGSNNHVDNSGRDDKGGGGKNGGSEKNGGGYNGKDGRDGRNGRDGRDGRNGRDGGGGSNISVGGGNSHEYGSTSIVCRINNRTVYVASFRQCNELKYTLGYGQVRRSSSVVVRGGCNCSGSVGYATGGYGYYQPQRVIRYVARPSRAAQLQAEKRARRAAQAYGNGYGDGGMVGYGNGVMVGGYGNNVVVSGGVYGGQQVIVKQKRKHKRSRRVVYQQPMMDQGMMYDNGYGYDYQGPTMYKGGGY